MQLNAACLQQHCLLHLTLPPLLTHLCRRERVPRNPFAASKLSSWRRFLHRQVRRFLYPMSPIVYSDVQVAVCAFVSAAVLRLSRYLSRYYYAYCLLIPPKKLVDCPWLLFQVVVTRLGSRHECSRRRRRLASHYLCLRVDLGHCTVSHNKPMKLTLRVLLAVPHCH